MKRVDGTRHETTRYTITHDTRTTRVGFMPSPYVQSSRSGVQVRVIWCSFPSKEVGRGGKSGGSLDLITLSSHIIAFAHHGRENPRGAGEGKKEMEEVSRAFFFWRRQYT